MCQDCVHLTRRYATAWQELSHYLLSHWRVITGRGSFDLSKVFSSDAAGRSLDVHLFFVSLLAVRLRAAQMMDLGSFITALLERTSHPEVSLLLADASVPAGHLLLHDSEVSMLRSGEEVQSAMWTHLQHPVAIKVCYLKTGAPVRAPDGFPWHPLRQRKIVKISPYEGDTQPSVARRDLRL